MSRIIVTILLAVIFNCFCVGISPENKVEDVVKKNETKNETKNEDTNSKTVTIEIKDNLNNKTLNISKVQNVTGQETPPIIKDSDKVPKESENHTNQEKNISVINPISPNLPALNEPALHRLFYVLLGLSTVTVCYVAMKMYRVRKGVTRPTHVRKYGVLTQRSDIEMEPLHLDDDEDDDTVFDVGAHANR